MNEAIDIYKDIIDLPAPRPKNRVPMPRAERAAQFSAFAALTAHGEAICETSRLTETRPELSDGAKAEINEKLQMILRRPGGDVCLTWFVADARKAGGARLRTTGAVQKLDTAQRQLLLQDGRSIPLDDILALELL